MMIEGKFHYIYDPQQYVGKTQDEMLKAQEAIKDALAESVGFGLVAAEIEVRWESTAALAQVSNATPATFDMLCTFTFPCPIGATPEEVTASMRTITTRSFLSILAPKLAGLGHEPFAFTATSFIGAAVVSNTSTASPSPSPKATTSFIPVASTLPATTTTEAPKKDFHPCKSLEDYMPEAKMSDYGWCNMEGSTIPSESECVAANCSAYGYPDHAHCHCATEEGCALISGTWKYHLCKEEMQMYQHGETYTLWEEATALGTCDGVMTSWHSTLPESIDWPARKCCASWPQTFCEPGGTLATPCKDASDFLADHMTDHGVTCMDWLHQWWSEYWTLKNASAAGSCSGMDLPWGESLQDWVTHPAKQCCASFPATICDKDAKFMTPCKVAADFTPEQELHSHCEFKSMPDNVTCEAAGCTYYQEHHYCSCSVEVCSAAGGVWKIHTCAKEQSHWPLKMHRALQEAAEEGSCGDLEYDGDLQGETQWSSQKCCASFPASVCNPTAKRMTPCESEADFIPTNVLHEWCEVNPVPDASTCGSHGCHGDGSYCHCSSHSSCASLGGSWKTSTCGEDLGHKDVAWHQAVAQASDDGTCGQSRVHDSTVEDAISWSSRKCCASYPANACYKGLKKMTPCKDDADFLPGHFLHEWCEFHGTVPETCGTTPGCHAGEGWCHCDNYEACTAAGGAWNQRTCDAEIQEWDSKKHLAVQSAATGNCEDVDWHGQPMSVALQHESSKCCASYPASVCDPTTQKMTPCKDEADFMPSNPLHQWCELHGASVDSDTCTAHGCTSHNGHCHCDSQSSCDGVGGTWKVTTCDMEMGYWEPAKHKALQEAYENGTCGVDSTYGDLVSMIDYPARQCCASFPATLCDPTAKKMTPCKDEADFMPSNVVHEYCDLHGSSVDSDTCTAHGCRSNHGHCHCDSQPSCEGVGGTWQVTTCDMEIGYWEPAKHKALREADESGTCGVHTMYGDLANMIDYTATKCCASFPATLCDKTARHMTPCKDEGDYTPDKEMYAWCDFYSDGAVMPEETVCNAQEGCYGGQGWCHCADRASCEAVGAFWNAHTCAKELSQWSPEQHKMLQKADEHGTCLDLEVRGMRAQDFVNWPAQQCCKSFPASICDKDVQAMTPCLRSQDFDHNKTMWAWCEGLYPAPAEADCHAQGCTGNEHHCHCETAAACTALGGKYVEYQCWQDLQWMAAEVHKGIATAINQGTCEDVEAHHNKLEFAVDWLGSSCCATGMSVCQELATGASLY